MPFIAALLGLALNEAAYMAEIVRAGILSVSEGQTEAAAALGMRRGLPMRRIVLPQAMRVIIPPTGNELISMLKTTSLVVAVPYTLDLYSRTRDVSIRLFQPVPLLIVAGDLVPGDHVGADDRSVLPRAALRPRQPALAAADAAAEAAAAARRRRRGQDRPAAPGLIIGGGGGERAGGGP